jgi:hypothetical protein
LKQPATADEAKETASMGAEVFPWVFTSGWASGINAYAVVLVMGLAERIWTVSGIPDALARTDVLVAAAVLFVIELVADKIPYLDSAWDSVHTVIRPVIGATLGYLFANEHASVDAAFLAATGGFSALASHLVKAGTRVAVNSSPEPASNMAVSTAEDVTVVAVLATAFANPWIAAVIAGVLLVTGATVVVFVLRRLRRVRARYRAWGERHGIGSQPPSTRSTDITSRPPGGPPG